MDDLTSKGFTKTFARTAGARFHAASRLSGHYPMVTALRTRVEEEVEHGIRDFVEVDAATHGSCRRKSFKANGLKMRVCGT